MFKCLNQIKDYLPRHLRLGVISCSAPIKLEHDILETIPIVADDGSVVRTESVIKSVPAEEDMLKYKVSAFRLSALVASGVPLKIVNINSSNTVTIDKLAAISSNLDAADKFVQGVLAQQKERESWFSEPEPNKNVEP